MKAAAGQQGVAGLSAEQIAKAEELANWEFIKASDSAQEFRDHLARFPSGVTERMARRKLEDLVFAQLGRSPAQEAIDSFLEEFPDGRYAEDARAIREKLGSKEGVRTTRSPETQTLPSGSLLLRRSVLGVFALLLVAGALMQSPLPADTAVFDPVDSVWVLGASLIPLATVVPAIALFYGGLARSGNLPSVFGRVLLIVAVTAMVWLAWGYSLGFTEGTPYIGSLSKRFLAGVNSSALSGTIPEYGFVLLMMASACMTAAMVAGAFMNRLRLPALLVFTALWILLVYTPVTHWIWGGGFLAYAGLLDFSGGLNSFVAGGAAGVIGLLVMGVRIDGELTRESSTKVVFGAALLWLGWIGLIAGSYVAAPSNAPNAISTLWNVLATAFAGALAWLLIEQRPSLLGAVWGALAALAAFAPASGFVTMTAAVVLGAGAALAAFAFVAAVRSRAGYVFQAVGIFLIAGIIGMIGTGILAAEKFGGTPGMIEGNPGQVVTQFWGVAATLIWSAAVTLVIVLVIRLLGGSSDSEAAR